MKKNEKECKLCGKKYEYCHSLNMNSDTFRWQDVACCKEHAIEYINKIKKNRNAEKEKNNNKIK